MKRYTFFTDDYPVVTGDHCWEDQNEDYCGPAIERLAEYEATGLMPAEVAALQYQLRHARGGQRWIPVTERLPEDGEAVLIMCKIGKMFVGHHKHLYPGCDVWRILTARNSTKEVTYTITHWMPLPEPPKEVE